MELFVSAFPGIRHAEFHKEVSLVYVFFFSQKNVVNWLKAHNNKLVKIDGKKYQVTDCSPTRFVVQSRTLAVSSYGTNVTEEFLMELFSGGVTHFLPQVCYVTFPSFKLAEKYQKKYDKQEVAGKVIRVALTAPSEDPEVIQRRTGEKFLQDNRFLTVFMTDYELFVTNIGKDATFADIKECFPGAFKVKRLSETGSCFVKYNSEEQAQNALDAMNGKEIGGKPVHIRFSGRRSRPNVSTDTATKKAARPVRSEIIVLNVASRTKEEKLKSLFVQSSKIRIVKDGKVFITFKCTEDARNAVRDVNGKVIDGNKVTCKLLLGPVKKKTGGKKAVQLK